MNSRTPSAAESTRSAYCRLAVVVPVKGKSEILKESLSSLCLAVGKCKEAILVLVDNNDPDDRDPELYSFHDRCTILKSDRRTIGAVRNDGFSSVRDRVEYVAFVDSDCVVKLTFCTDVLDAFRATGATAVGCKVVSPSSGHWTELATDALHRQGGDGYRNHLNSGCLAVRAPAFSEIGGFSEELPANEDYDLCRRIRENGGRIWQSERLQVIHLGNPKTIPQFFRRLRWHGRGAVNEAGKVEFSAMLTLTLLNAIVAALGFGICLFLFSKGQIFTAILFLGFCVIVVPVIFWLLRMLQFRRWINPATAVPLMQLTFAARLMGLRDQKRLTARRDSPKPLT